jgi:aryl-alcohol dehydrogenase-like predicted oxidoreductase
MSDIEYRKLGSSGIEVPALGVGTQAWGDKRWGFGKSYSPDDLFRAYQTSIDAGLNYFDTSDSYGNGQSEELLGEFYRKDGRPVIISTKFTPAKPYDPNTHFSSKAVLPTLERSVQRLGLKTIDLYQIHYPPAQRRLDKFLDAMAEGVESGKAKAVGVSNFNVEQLRYSQEYLTRHHNIPVASNQISYSLLDRHLETNGMLAACRELNISVIAILPLAEGVLTGKYRGGKLKPSRTLSVMLRAAQIIEQQTPLRERVFIKPLGLQPDKLESLFFAMEEVGHAHNATLAQTALNWLLASDPLILPIPGAKSLEQAASNGAALTWRMSQEEFERLAQIEDAISRSR